MIPDATLAHKHEFAVDATCDCGISISQLVYEQAAEIRRLREEQSFHDGLDDGIIRRLRAQVEMLHGLVEEAVNGWKGALPHGDDVSTLVKQDRLTCHDLVRKADAIFMSGGGKARGSVTHVCSGGAYCPVCQERG